MAAQGSYCICDEQRLFQKPKIYHVLLHLALTVLTLSLWGIVWIVLSNVAKPMRCRHRGTATMRMPASR